MKESIISGSFDWDSYLLDTNAVLADKKCFKQAEIPPDNYFEVDVLLEAVDQRSAVHDITPLNFQETPNRGGKHKNSGYNQMRRYRAAPFSLAYVVEIWGPRIRVRLVGTDDRNDNWFMIDSDQIRPYPSGEPLQPPFGYMKSHHAWNKTISKESSSKRPALKEWFYKPPPDPPSNLFKINDKLEAIDKRNAQLICPASIGDISGHYILVRFDGWSGAFDYWTRYDSRDIFPVGWCKNANHPLQPPGPVMKNFIELPVNNKSHEENIEKKIDEEDDLDNNTTLRNNNPSSGCSKELNKPANSACIKRNKRKYSDQIKEEEIDDPDQQKVNHHNTTEDEIDAMFSSQNKPKKSRSKKKEKRKSIEIKQENDEILDRSFDTNVKPSSHSSPKHQPKEQKISTNFNLNELLASQIIPTSSSHSSSEQCPSMPTTKITSPDRQTSEKIASNIQIISPFNISPIDLRYMKDPNNWSIEQVNDYLISKSDTLRNAANLFKEHEIDGQAFLLLTLESLNWMKIKVGPALKIIHLIECLSQGYY